MAGTLRDLIVPKDRKGSEIGGLRAPSYTNSRALAANTAETIAVPSGANWVLFSATADMYADFQGQTAVVPGDVTDGSAPELNPSMRYIGNIEAISALSTISVISAATCIVTASFWS